MIEPSYVGYGREASEALASTIAQVKQAGPLAPITVVVSSNFVGLSARRLLGSAHLQTGQRAGIANVSFVTPFQLAELVAADLLLETKPITNPVLGAAARRVLADDPGPYAPVARHEATEAALASLFAELANVDEQGLESIADEGSTAAILAVRFYRAIARHLDGFHTEHDLATAAADRSDLGRRLEPFGHIIWYLPAPVTPALGRFLDRALHDAASSSVIVGITGDDDADEPVWRSCDLAGVLRRPPGFPAPITGDHIVSVTDAAEEVRVVCSRIFALAAAGMSLDRIGVFYPSADPYVRIIEQQFAAAELISNGPDPRRVADSVAGRTLLGALSLPAVRWRRDRVIALISGAPVRSGNDPVRPTTWDSLSRESGVVRDLADWRSKLEHDRSVTQTRLEAIIESGDELADADASSRRRQRLVDRLADNRQLLQFVERLAELVGGVAVAHTWPDKCAAATDLLHALLGPEHRHVSWPEAEQDAFGRVEDALVRLAALADIEGRPTPEVFMRALRAELDVARGRHGRFGHGVLYGPLGTAVGHDLDAVFVLGAAEGLLPVPRRDDAVLPEAVRLHSLDQLESKSVRLHHQHRAFLAALASAPAGNRTIVFPRGDLRSNRRALPSRWLLDTASRLAGRRVHATEFGDLGDGIVDTVGSFSSGIRRGHPPSSVHERDLIALGAAVETGCDAATHPLARLAGGGLLMQRERASARFTVFDGNLGSLVGSHPGLPETGDRAMSPSRLESWAACGFRYFLKYLLDVSDRDDPERVDDISALDRGSLIHQILEQFVGEVIESGPPKPDQAWTAAHCERLHQIAEARCSEYEVTGRTGRPASWRVRRDDLNDTLGAFLRFDNDFRRHNRATPIAVELDLGVRNDGWVPVELSNGKTVTLHGVADRVDTTEDGRVVVTDYKSGKGARYDDLGSDPFAAGTTLQLGMYAEGAMRNTGLSSSMAHYWLVESANPLRGYEWTPSLRRRFDELLAAITDGIAGGVFAMDPGDWDTWRQTNDTCTYCEFDSVCVRSRGEQAAAKQSAPEVGVRGALVPSEAQPDVST